MLNGKFLQPNSLHLLLFADPRRLSPLKRNPSSGVATNPIPAFEHDPTNLIRKGFVKFSVTNQKTHVNRSIERIQNQVKVGAVWQFASVNSALQCSIGLPTSWKKKSFAESFNQLWVRLPSSEQGRHDPATIGSENANQPSHLQAHIAAHIAGIGKTKFGLGARGERVRD
jgi:hypothetical protein